MIGHTLTVSLSLFIKRPSQVRISVLQFLGDEETVAKAIASVAAQGKAK